LWFQFWDHSLGKTPKNCVAKLRNGILGCIHCLLLSSSLLSSLEMSDTQVYALYIRARFRARPLSREHGPYKTVKARFGPWLSGEHPEHRFWCSLFALNRPAASLSTPLFLPLYTYFALNVFYGERSVIQAELVVKIHLRSAE